MLMNKKIRNISREIEHVCVYQMENPDLKNTISEI